MPNLNGVKASGRVLPHKVLDMRVRNQSSRNGITPRLIVLHSTESSNVKGKSDLEAIGAWFDNPKAQASAHVATDADGNSARYVDDKRKAWSCVNFNSISLNIEQIGRAAQDVWDNDELLETARWIALWHRRFGIPIVRATGPDWVGVARHSDLGFAGGSHHDPGPDYPLDEVLRVARGFQHLWEAGHRK